MILIITNTQDPHADKVIQNLRARKRSVFRLNTEDFLGKYRTKLAIASDIEWCGSCTDELGRELNLRLCRVGWIRRPDFSFAYAEGLEDETSKFVLCEFRAFIDNLYALPNIDFVNDHFSSARSKNKFQQLILACELGMRVPRTIITNDVAEAEKFARTCGSNYLLTKPIYTSNFLHDGVPQGISSARITLKELQKNLNSISVVPTKIQEYVEKQFEVRVVVIAGQVFAVKIDSQLDERTKVDWRTSTAVCPHVIIDLPDSVGRFCIDFLKCQSLVYGAFDFIVTPDNEYVFLENNPAGQYLWLEDVTGIPITDALCEYFSSRDTAMA